MDGFAALREKVEAHLSSYPVTVTKPTPDLSRAGDLIGTYMQWRYEHPGLSMVAGFFSFNIALSLMLLLAWTIADTSFGAAIGLSSTRSRIEHAYYAVVWSTAKGDGIDTLPIAPERVTATIERIVGDVLIVSYFDKQGQRIQRLVRPANVILTDKAGFASWARKYLLVGVTLDFYIPIDKVSGRDVWGVVIWRNRVPVNIELVEQGLGYPEKNPPTAVVNQIFSQYYWTLAKG